MSTGVQLPLQVRHGSRESLQEQIFRQVRGLILDGRLRPGMLVPASRALERQLGISRNTALLTYERLIAEGYLETRPAVGTFVSSSIPENSLVSRTGKPLDGGAADVGLRQPMVFHGRPHGVFNPRKQRLSIDFKVGRPDPGSFPARAWRRLTMHRLEDAGRELTEYGDPSGLPELRKAIADHLGPARGISAEPDQIIITAGCQEALDIVARLFVAQGTRVVTECPCYQGAANLFSSYGAELVRIRVDAEGVDVGQLPETPVSLVYVTPSHQYPLGATLSLERRFRLLEWAARTGAYIVEDDYDSDFRHQGSPLTALKGLDGRGCVIYLGTFSKSIGAGLRLGYMVVPEGLARSAGAVKALLNNGQPWLDQAVVADFVRQGEFATHLRRIRRTYLARRDCLVAALRERFDDVDLLGLEGGMHIAWRLPLHFPPAEQLESLARRRGVAVYSAASGAVYCDSANELIRRVVLLGYSSLSERQIREGVTRIAAALSEAGIPSAD